MNNSLKNTVLQQAQSIHGQLVDISNDLHANPEIGWQEHRSAKILVDYLRQNGFEVEHPYLGLDTAFRAVYKGVQNPKFTVGFLAEYDALPGLGHACGHNLIATMSTGAGTALSKTAAEQGISVEVIGTPAEEGGGGKVEMLNRGAFQNLDFALMAHPAPVDVAEAEPFAVTHWHVKYEGKAAHAAAYPERGINANDAFLVAQLAISLLRQQLPASVRVHGVQTNGGEAPNAIPEVTEGRWYVRATTTEELLALEKRVTACFEAGALATGAKLTITAESERYAEMRTDEEALKLYKENAVALGRDFNVSAEQATMNRASTDMGNVSQIVAAIHPYIGVNSTASNHQPEFADACVGDIAEQTLHDGMVALAWTALDMALKRAAK